MSNFIDTPCVDRIIYCLREHRFDDSMVDEVFCHEADNSPMVGLKRGPNPQADWEEWVDHVAPILAAQLT
jgi:hypothetical protein